VPPRSASASASALTGFFQRFLPLMVCPKPPPICTLTLLFSACRAANAKHEEGGCSQKRWQNDQIPRPHLATSLLRAGVPRAHCALGEAVQLLPPLPSGGALGVVDAGLPHPAPALRALVVAAGGPLHAVSKKLPATGDVRRLSGGRGGGGGEPDAGLCCAPVLCWPVMACVIPWWFHHVGSSGGGGRGPLSVRKSRRQRVQEFPSHKETNNVSNMRGFPGRPDFPASAGGAVQCTAVQCS
jgi:hypothetical protein